MVAVFGVHPQLVHHLKLVLAPLLDIDKRVLQRRAVLPLERIPLLQCLRRHERIGGDDLIAQPPKLRIRQAHPVQRLKFLPEILFQRLPAPYIGPVGVFEVGKFTD